MNCPGTDLEYSSLGLALKVLQGFFCKSPRLEKHSIALLSYNGLEQYQQGKIFFFFFLGIYFIYISNAIPKVTSTLPHPPTPTSWPWHFPVLRHIKFAWPMGLSFHWWPTRPSSDTYAARDMSSRGYWLVHIVALPIGLQIPPAPWVLSLAPPLGACDPSNRWLCWHSCLGSNQQNQLDFRSAQ